MMTQRILAVIESLYAAASDEQLWPDALRQLMGILDCQAATMWVLDDTAEPRLPALTAINFDAAFMHDYLDHMVPQDPTVQYLVAHKDQPIIHDGQYLTETQIDRHPYYDWHFRSTDMRYRLLGQIAPAPHVQAGIALHRAPKTGRFQSGDLEKFSSLFGHLKQALTIGYQLGRLGAIQGWTSDLLDICPMAIVLLDEHHRLMHANLRARVLDEAGDGVGLSSAGITLKHHEDHKRLQSLIALAVSQADEVGCWGGAMTARRCFGKRDYQLQVIPLVGEPHSLSSSRPVVCITIKDPDEQSKLSQQQLQEIFGMTRGEALLAVSLAQGNRLKVTAEQLGITYGTARARLADIFQKTHTSRQGELIALVLTTLLNI